MRDSSKAVFLSYASQDAEAAKRIADALRGAGVEVWFDAEGGLEQGDEWDAKIRRQIKECVLFIPIVSANTEARDEGYFRIEWDLAAERARGIASGVAFILPVVIDGTREQGALVPDRFRAVQWSKLPGGNVPAEVLQRFLKLWSHRMGALKHGSREQRAGSGEPEVSDPETRHLKPRASPHLGWVIGGVAVLLIAGALAQKFLQRSPTPAHAASTSNPEPKASNPAPAAPLTEAGRLIEQAWAIYEKMDNASRDEWELAEEIAGQATKLEPRNAEGWAVSANMIMMPYVFGMDTTPARLARATKAAQRAISLEPRSVNARLALANCYRMGDASLVAEAERIIRALMAEQPQNKRVLRMGGNVLRYAGKFEDAVAAYDRAMALPGGDPVSRFGKERTLRMMGRFVEAEALIDEALAADPGPPAQLRKIYHVAVMRDDLTQAAVMLEKIPADFLLGEEGANIASLVWLWRRDADRCIAVLKRYAGEKVLGEWKGRTIGLAYWISGRPDAARLEWQSTLKLIDARLAEAPSDTNAILQKVLLLAAVGDKTGAEALRKTYLQLQPPATAGDHLNDAFMQLGLERPDEALVALERAVDLPDNPRLTVGFRALIRHHPSLDPLRGLPRFQALLAKLNAMPVGAAAGNPAAAAAAKADDKSVAVLPFANRSDDKSNEYFSDGISEELLNVLAKVPGLKVSARTSAFSFKGREVPVPEIAKQLGVAYVVEGSVRKQGDKVRITAQLIKAADGFQVWNDTFTRDSKDVFAVQDEIAGLIAQQLRVNLGAAPKVTRTVNPEAHQLYLQGRFFINQFSFESAVKGAALVQQALALDPDFARAWAALSKAGTICGGYGNTRQEVEDGYALARRAAEKALALDPELAVAHVALADVQMGHDFNWKGARESLRRALLLAPQDAEVLDSAGRLGYCLGQKEEAVTLVGQALALDPVNPSLRGDYGAALAAVGRFDEAEAEYRRLLELNPTAPWSHSGIAITYLFRGRFDDAVAEVNKETTEWTRLFLLAMAEWGRKNRPAADAALAQLERKYQDVAAFQLAQVHAFRGEPDRAFEWLERAYRQRDPGLTWARPDLILEKLHPDPRWDAFLRKLGLTDEQLK